MLSIEKCREILGQSDLNDSEIEKIRVNLYDMVNLALDSYLEKEKTDQVARLGK